MKTSLDTDRTQALMASLTQANQRFNATFPGDRPDRQPVHTVYGGAQLFKAETTQKMGALARRTFGEYAPHFGVLAHALKLPGYQQLPTAEAEARRLGDYIAADPENARFAYPAAWLAYEVHRKIRAKLEREPVEDFRIDFEDGFGNRPDAEEDETAVFAAGQVAKAMKENSLPPFIGIRIKTFSEELKSRAVRTMDLFLTHLLEQTGGKLPQNFVVTLPKVVAPEQVGALVDLFEQFEDNTRLKPGSLKLEVMVETTRSIFDASGRIALPAIIGASRGRCVAAHFGTYDYTAACDITARYQEMDHPACDFARHVMKVALAGTGIWLSDGATNVMPVGPHRAGDTPLTPAQAAENQSVVHNAWHLGYGHIIHSLKHGFYQGWDLHPNQLPIRYAACYTFFLQGLPQASARLKNFIEKAAQATLVGDVFDDAATGQGLLNYFLRAMNCGAIEEKEITATGLTTEEVRAKSFLKILESRRASR